MTHKEFYIWLDGFLTNRSWAVVKESDIDAIKEKMKEVKNDLGFDLELLRNKKNTSPFNPVIITRGDEDDLGHPPKIVM